MYSFEGDFRPGKPKVSISGRSHTSSHADVIRQAQEARLKRERDRKRVESATVIQAAFRGYRDRERCRQNFLTEFEPHLQTASTSKDDALRLQAVHRLFAGAALHARPSRDAPQLIKLLSFCLSNQAFLVPRVLDGSLEHGVKRLLVIASRLLRGLTTKNDATAVAPNSHALPLRVLETFFDVATYGTTSVGSSSSSSPRALLSRIVLFCVRRGFFDDIIAFFDDRVPVDVQLAAHSTPHLTPLAKSILALITVPLTHCDDAAGHEGATVFSDAVYLSLTQSVVAGGISRQTNLLLLPHLAQSGCFSMATFLSLLKRSLPPKRAQLSKVTTPTTPAEEFAALRPTAWLLLAVVAMAQRLLNENTNVAVIADYFEVLDRFDSIFVTGLRLRRHCLGSL